jgi:hypothetical protein
MPHRLRLIRRQLEYFMRPEKFVAIGVSGWCWGRPLRGIVSSEYRYDEIMLKLHASNPGLS